MSCFMSFELCSNEFKNVFLKLIICKSFISSNKVLEGGA